MENRKMKYNTTLKIIDMNGRKCRREKDTLENLGNAFLTLSIANIVLNIVTTSLQSSKIIDAHLESGVRVHAREVVRV